MLYSRTLLFTHNFEMNSQCLGQCLVHRGQPWIVECIWVDAFPPSAHHLSVLALMVPLRHFYVLCLVGFSIPLSFRSCSSFMLAMIQPSWRVLTQCCKSLECLCDGAMTCASVTQCAAEYMACDWHSILTFTFAVCLLPACFTLDFI